MAVYRIFWFPRIALTTSILGTSRQLSTQSSLPWLIDGDFNEILSNDEKKGGLLQFSALMDAFRDGLSNCELHDLGFTGAPFTWSNQWVDPHTVWCRLDRFCGSGSWQASAPHSHVQHLIFSRSDHSPLILRLR